MRVAVVTSICVPFDAISAVVRQSVIWAGEAGHDVRLFTYRCEFDDIPVTEVTSAAALALDPFFASSDVVIFHLGIYYELFGALLARGPRSALLVRFHNITPRELVPSWDYEVIDKSMAQATLLRFADEVHCDSWFSMQELAERKLEAPLAVRDIAATVSLEPPVTKPGHADGVLRLLFVGRFVRSKGPLELVAAIDEALPGIVHDHVRLDLVGNVGFSDAAYLASVEQAGAVLQRRSGGRFTMQVHGSVPDSERNRLLREADVFVLPTYHEGFCVPVRGRDLRQLEPARHHRWARFSRADG
jgi:glycosyltransferase involved in cell wall biosynthesis